MPNAIRHAITFTAGLLVGGFAIAYLAVYQYPYVIFMRAIEVGSIILPVDPPRAH
jgi:hypothetical protein